MNESDQAICHCMIKHPSAAKFLAIKHADGWSPPVALVTESVSLVSQAHKINQGLLESYGFMTAVLRQIAASPGYRCIEVERLTEYGRGGMQAVWVGTKEYSEFRRSSPDQYDPIAAWLEEKEQGGIPGARPAWEQPGWFAEAREWIQNSVKELGIHQQGPVEQFRAFKTSSSILRVPVARGHVYFKACMQSSPPEAVLTDSMAEKWPQTVDKPLRIHAERNWMLSRDYSGYQQSGVEYSDYPKVAKAMAEIQLGSNQTTEHWRELGCQEVSLQDLSEFAANLDGMVDLLVEGGGEMALTTEEVAAVLDVANRQQELLDELSAFSIPSMLVHPDLWRNNIYRKKDGFGIYDWSGTVISHPFFSLTKLIRFRELEQELKLQQLGDPADDDGLIDGIISAYLEEFSSFETSERLEEAFSLVRQLSGLWRLFVWRNALDHEENMSVSYQVVVRHLQRIARQMAETA